MKCEVGGVIWDPGPLGPGTWDLELGSRDLGPGIWDLGLGIWEEATNQQSLGIWEEANYW